jgi:hypothetical protein
MNSNDSQVNYQPAAQYHSTLLAENLVDQIGWALGELSQGRRIRHNEKYEAMVRTYYSTVAILSQKIEGLPDDEREAVSKIASILPSIRAAGIYNVGKIKANVIDSYAMKREVVGL